MAVTGLSIISLFKAHPMGSSHSEEEEKEHFIYKLYAVGTGLLASTAIGCQILFIKSLIKYGVSGFQSAMFYVFFGGVLGTLILIVSFIVDKSHYDSMSWVDKGYCMLVGFLIFMG